MTLSKEKLAHYAMHTDGPVKAMARELLERRGRDKQEPDGWQFLGVNGLWVSVTENGMREALKEGCEVRPLYAAPQLPQPAVVIEGLYKIANHIASCKGGMPEEWQDWAGEIESDIRRISLQPVPDKMTTIVKDEHDYVEGWNACRAAMLQGAEPVQEQNQTAGSAYKCRSSEKVQVLQDGWVAVPVEPTEKMVIEGFESVPHPLFQPADWDKYQTMSGCEQAAHRAKLCWAAMIKGAPKP